MPDSADVLIFVEDPGAANYVAPLPAALAAYGRKTVVFAAGIARTWLLKRGVSIRGVDPSAAVDQILRTIRPRLLLVGTALNPDTLGLPLVTAARSAGIISVGVIDAVVNAERRFRGRSNAALTYAPDWLLVPDDWTKQAFVGLGFLATRVVVCGHPQYDYVLDMATQLVGEEGGALRRRVLPGAPPNQKVVVFVAEGSARVSRQLPDPPFHKYTLRGRGRGRGRTEIVLEEFLDAIRSVNARPYLVLRPHPKDTADDYSAYLHEFDLVDSNTSALELVYSADLVVGATSMLLLEAALLGKPTLSILPRLEEKEGLPSIRAGVTSYVTTSAELRSALMGMLEEGLQPLRRKPHHFFASGSLQRTVAFVEGLLAASS